MYYVVDGVTPEYVLTQDNYVFQELSASDSGVTMKVTLIKMKIGVPDSVFKFDPKRYPNAVIVRK